MKLICPACGKRYENGKFCLECGTALIEEKVEMVCPACGTVCSSGKFCPECGTKLVEKGTAPAKQENAVNSQRDPRFDKYYDKKGSPRTVPAEEVQVALEELRPFVEQGLPEAQMLAGYIMACNSIDVDKSMELIKKADDGGNKPASYLIGMITIEHGEIAGISMDEAEKRVLEGYSELRDPEFAAELAKLYAFIETKIDYSKALEYAQAGAEGDDPGALRVLGYLHQKGLGVEPDVEKAVEYYKMAAAYGDSQAYKDLGYLFLGNDGHPQDYEQAFYWTNEAAKNGDMIGMYNLGLFYRDGVGVERDVESAADWLKKAADLGFENAMYELGEYYSQTLIDPGKSLEWFRKAAELGHEEAMKKCTDMTLSASIENVKIERTTQAGKDGIAISADIVLNTPSEGELIVDLYDIDDFYELDSLFGLCLKAEKSFGRNYFVLLDEGLVIKPMAYWIPRYYCIPLAIDRSVYRYSVFIEMHNMLNIDGNKDFDLHLAAIYNEKVIGDYKQKVHIESSKSFMSARKWTFYLKK